ncbi:DUF6029 family protein [Flavobacterium terrisoli]|uniref:DUF6029 family protein n=1 Tax=Flavobacterium terrisoli TaxID=3242195 RepID=UPI0025439259|nr:DUF6029 family protein [Flavobacterium buctense]
MKKAIYFLFLLLPVISFSQNSGVFSGGFESNAQWYLNDKGLKDEFNNPTVHPEDPVRSNNYLFLNYKYKNWSAGIQGESYEQNALLNMNPKYNGTNVATYFVQFKTEKIDITAGYFYEQFGSGLLLRSWEDRALGINNALRGGRIIFKPVNYITIKTLYGRQRTGFDVARSDIYGADLEFDLKTIFKFQTSDLTLGFSYVGRDEKTNLPVQDFNNLTYGVAGRINFTHNSFYASTEMNYKSEDAVVQVTNQVNNRLVKPGSALLLNTGYSKKGFGIDATFRRLENMSFFSERGAKGNEFNDRIMNFIPSLTKQQHYNLANIYVYQAQPSVFLADQDLVKAGEIGGQIDVFYDIKKGTALGGKNGMKIAFNCSNWNALSGTYYIFNPQNYETDFLSFGKRYYTDYNIEITKKWNNKWQSAFSYINQYYNKKMVEGTDGEIRTNVLAAEATYKFTAIRSLRVVGEHMWADYDKKNWAASTVEFNINSKWSCYVTDLYNYGNDLEYQQNHYYNLGGAFRKNSTRIALSYGRQRGGLVCVGGVCRNVPESSGVSLSLNTSF